MQLHEALGAIGLSEKESAVYTALLQLGRASAYSVSEKSGLKKPTTYVILDELIKKGVVSRVPREKKQLYVARPPEEAFAVAEERIALEQQKLVAARGKLPELLALTRGKKTKVNMMYFEGVNGIKRMLEYGKEEMKGKEMVGFYAIDPQTHEELTQYVQHEWNEKMLRLGVTMRGIVPDHPSLKTYRKTDEKYKRETKIIPYKQYSSDVALDVIGDMVRIQDYKNLQGVLLENPDVAKTVREIFEMVWKCQTEPIANTGTDKSEDNSENP